MSLWRGFLRRYVAAAGPVTLTSIQPSPVAVTARSANAVHVRAMVAAVGSAVTSVSVARLGPRWSLGWSLTAAAETVINAAVSMEQVATTVTR